MALGPFGQNIIVQSSFYPKDVYFYSHVYFSLIYILLGIATGNSLEGQGSISSRGNSFLFFTGFKPTLSAAGAQG